MYHRQRRRSTHADQHGCSSELNYCRNGDSSHPVCDELALSKRRCGTDSNFTHINVRSGEAGEYVGGIENDGTIFISRFLSGSGITNLDFEDTNLDPVGGDVLLQFDVFGNQLIGQRHFVADFCRKLWPDNTISHGVYVSGGIQDLILSASIPMAVSRSILVFVCDLRACLFRRW